MFPSSSTVTSLTCPLPSCISAMRAVPFLGAGFGGGVGASDRDVVSETGVGAVVDGVVVAVVLGS